MTDVVKEPDGALCMTNMLCVGERGFYFLELNGVYPDNELTREYVGLLSDCTFLFRSGFTVWILDKKSFRKFGLIERNLGLENVKIVKKEG